jgi:signal transduction histidine kinase
MPSGGTITAILGMHDDGRLAIRIADTGTGIAAERLPRIFDAFYTTKDAGHGSGLGLVVARDIVSQHDGEIRVSSEPGVGTEFLILLPVGAA